MFEDCSVCNTNIVIPRPTTLILSPYHICEKSENNRRTLSENSSLGFIEIKKNPSLKLRKCYDLTVIVGEGFPQNGGN
ncbi:hypothetical protein B5X24_HaOG215730 [Helicoverpa armigera]|nr:hypothetical protein B5X24_HaOG215730 [Helicoverpa armigera]